jgi:peroxiredoxin family protein
MYFTFWGMDAIMIKWPANLKVSAVGNPGLPMPNMLGMILGMTSIATCMMKGKIGKAKVTSIPEMLKAIE